MVRDVDDMLARANAVMARHGATPQAIAAQGRRVGRAAGELGRRAARAVGAIGAAGVGAIGYSVAVAPLGVEALMIAAPVTGLAALGLMLLPTRREVPAPKFVELPLGRLGVEAEDWLVRRRPVLPRTALSTIDRIAAQLHEIAPQLAPLNAGDETAADARRLLSEHLPRLVDAYLAVPASARTGEPEAQLKAGLDIVAGELDRIGRALAAAKVRDLAVEGRFLEAKYKNGGV